MNKLIQTLILLLISSTCWSQANISGIINTYAAVISVDTSNNAVSASNANNFTSGDLVMIIQMQGAEIDESLSNTFGTIKDYNSSGHYELQRVCGQQGNEVYFQNPFKHQYDTSGSVQLIKIPEFANGVSLNGILTGQEWNGSTGGIVAIKVDGQLDLSSFSITMSEKGFRGGEALPSGGGCTFLSPTREYSARSSANDRALKGEGIATYITGKECSRGPQANGGGGGNNHNGGGSGGSNYGIGGAGGQRIKSATFACESVTGINSKSLSSELDNGRLFMGGGGGAGHGNNAGDAGEHGLSGGGIIFIIASEITGINRSGIYANGGSGTTNSENEGGGGAGAGGSIILDVDNVSSAINISANGGTGTYVTNFGTNCSGPGGGGGGGFVAFTGSSTPTLTTLNVSGGNAGEIASASQSGCNVGDKNGAVDGTDGHIATNYLIEDNISIQISSDTVSACNSYTSPSGSQIWTTSGQYLDTLITSSGCQSITQYNLTITTINDSLHITDSTSIMNNIYPTAWMAVESPARYQWINCESGTILSDTTQIFRPSEFGDYAAIISKDGCTDTSDCFTYYVLSTDEKALVNSISISPNPSRGSFTIHSTLGTIDKVSIYTLEGKLIQTVRNKDSRTIKSSLPEKGVYLMEINNGQSIIVKKLIIQ